MLTKDTVRRRRVGEFQGVIIDVAAWAPANAEVELSFACMFEREMPGTALSGGLLHLDQSIGGALTRLRSEGVFRAQERETLFLSQLPASILPTAIMVIGLGAPETLNRKILANAARVAAQEAIRLRVKTAAFAPDLLDAGHTESSTEYSAAAMLEGVFNALEEERRLSILGLTRPNTLKHWTFDAGTAHMDAAVASYLTEVKRLIEQPAPEAHEETEGKVRV